MSQEIKLCKDCRFYGEEFRCIAGDLVVHDYPVCRRKQTLKVDIVTGETIFSKPFSAWTQRGFIYGKFKGGCGKEGKYWGEKDE